jgi:hypothetical protein
MLRKIRKVHPSEIALAGALATILGEGALQVSGIQNTPLAIILGISSAAFTLFLVVNYLRNRAQRGQGGEHMENKIVHDAVVKALIEGQKPQERPKIKIRKISNAHRDGVSSPKDSNVDIDIDEVINPGRDGVHIRDDADPSKDGGS